MPFVFCIAVLPREIVDQGLSWAWGWALRELGKDWGEVEQGRKAQGR